MGLGLRVRLRVRAIRVCCRVKLGIAVGLELGFAVGLELGFSVGLG